MTENEISKLLIGIFIKVHKELGPGLLESIYEKAICYELSKNKIRFTKQQAIPVIYDGVDLKIGFRADIIIENKVIIELKSIEYVLPLHHKTLLTYLRLTNIKLGLLVNFNVVLLKEGISRVINNLDEV